MLENIPANREFDAYQAFVLDCKIAWTRQMFPLLRDRFEIVAKDVQPNTAADVAALMEGDTTAQMFGWFERHLQRMKYSGLRGLTVHYNRYRDEIRRALNSDLPAHLLQLDPDFQQPEYYTSIDIHQHPGGVWSDEIAGFVYERGAQSTAPMLKKSESLFHRMKTQAMTRASHEVKKVVDLGCGWGGSTRPYYEDHPEVDVIGVELSEPCLRVAALRAAELQAQNVRYRQADATETGLNGGDTDIVTSTMLLHEMPPSHIKAVFREAHRLLAPGGLSIHLDFLMRDDPFRVWVHNGHSSRNNEPFMVPLNGMDLLAAHKEAGFDAVEIVPFEEFDGALSPDNTAWRFPWTMIIARKPGSSGNQDL